jgi:hypothetical protein
MKAQMEAEQKGGQPCLGKRWVKRSFTQGKTGRDMVKNLLLAHRGLV